MSCCRTRVADGQQQNHNTLACPAKQGQKKKIKSSLSRASSRVHCVDGAVSARLADIEVLLLEEGGRRAPLQRRPRLHLLSLVRRALHGVLHIQQRVPARQVAVSCITRRGTREALLLSAALSTESCTYNSASLRAMLALKLGSRILSSLPMRHTVHCAARYVRHSQLGSPSRHSLSWQRCRAPATAQGLQACRRLHTAAPWEALQCCWKFVLCLCCASSSLASWLLQKQPSKASSNHSQHSFWPIQTPKLSALPGQVLSAPRCNITCSEVPEHAGDPRSQVTCNT